MFVKVEPARSSITADKRETKDFSKLPSATYFIRNTLYDIAGLLTGLVKYFINT